MVQVRCRRCNRVLHDPVSAAKGIGKTCQGKEVPCKRKRPKARIRTTMTSPGWGQLELFAVGVEQLA